MKKEESNIALALPGSITTVSLQLPSGLAYKEWLAAGAQIFRVRQTCHWLCGDWLRYGEENYGEMYAQAMDETEYSYNTLAKDKYVASRFDFLRRRKNLSWSHHEAVASLDRHEQDKWLDRAEKHKWTREDLREKIRAVKVKNDVAVAEILPAVEGEPESEKALAENAGSEEEENRQAVIEPKHLAVLIECDTQEQQRSLIERHSAEGLRCHGLSGAWQIIELKLGAKR